MKLLYTVATCSLFASAVSLPGCIVGPDHGYDHRDEHRDDHRDEHHCGDHGHDGDCDHHLR
jgi:hypothetical protein